MRHLPFVQQSLGGGGAQQIQKMSMGPLTARMYSRLGQLQWLRP